MTPNIENINTTIALIKANERFNMSRFFYASCGSPACVAGAIWHHVHPDRSHKDIHYTNLSWTASDFLGISQPLATELCVDFILYTAENKGDFTPFTPDLDQTVRFLEMVRDGEAVNDWSDVVPDLKLRENSANDQPQ